MSKTLAAQYAELTAAMQSFTRVPGTSERRSPLYPGVVIGACTMPGRPAYCVFRDGTRLVDFEWAFTFDGAVATALNLAA